LKQITVKIDEKIFEWLENQVREGRFASVSHGVRYALKQLMKQETDKLLDDIKKKAKEKILEDIKE